MGLWDLVRKGHQAAQGSVKPVSGGSYGGSYGLGSRLYGYGVEGIDYNKEAGVRWDNSIVYTLLSLLATTLGGVSIKTGRLVDAKPVAIDGHLITALLEKPNPWYSGSLLETGAIFLEGSRGNSYCFKHRSGAGRVIALELLPEGSCFPYTIPGSGEWVSYYAIATATGFRREKPENILHLRWMTLNPFWLQLGMSPLESCLPDLVADKLAAKHEASLLKNGAVSSIMMSPKATKDANGDVVLDLVDEQCEQIQRRVDARLTGDNKGSSFVFNVPMEYEQMGFDPKQMAMVETRHLSESRLCAAFNIPPVVANLLVGLKNANNRASYAGAVDQFFDGCAIPYMRHRGRQFTEDLVPELGQPGEVVYYDESAIPALKSRLVKQLMESTGGPLETPNEGRAAIGREPVEGGDVLRSAGAVNPKPTAEPEDTRKTDADTTENDFEDDTLED